MMVEDDHSDILDIIKNVRAEEADENMAKKLLSHYDTYRNYDEDEYDLEDVRKMMEVWILLKLYSFDGQGLDYDDQDDEEEDEEVMLDFEVWPMWWRKYIPYWQWQQTSL